MAPKRTRSWTPDELAQYYARQGQAVPADTAKVLSDLGLSNHARTSKFSPEAPAGELTGKPKKKRQGVSMAPLVASLKSSLVFTAAHVTPTSTFSVWFEGARLLTANEMIQVLQTRPQAMYAYKKASALLVKRAVQALHPSQEKPFFNGPTRISLYRRGSKLVDLDALPVMFKYITDALRKQGIITDDNPEILVETRLLQEQGDHALALRLEALPNWQPPDLEGLKGRWLEAPAAC